MRVKIRLAHRGFLKFSNQLYMFFGAKRQFAFSRRFSKEKALSSLIGLLSLSLLTSCGVKFKTSTDYLISGNEYFKSGDYDHAATDYRQALRKDPKNATAKNNLGVILNEEGKYTEAIELLRQAIQADPKNAIAHYVLANSLTKTGQFDEAIVQAKMATELDKTEPTAYKLMGEAAVAKGDENLAVDAFQCAIKLDPDNDQYHHGLARAYGIGNKIEPLIAEEKKAVELNPDNNEARLALAIALHKQGSDESVSELKKIIAKEPGNAVAQKYLREFEEADSSAAK